MRFTVRRLMVGVAILGMTFGGYLQAWRLVRLSERYSGRVLNYRVLEARAEFTSGMTWAEWRARSEQIERANARDGFKLGRVYPPELARRLLPYARGMALKYEYAASHPWLPVAPDPPEPE
jgi:hypothetical protein